MQELAKVSQWKFVCAVVFGILFKISKFLLVIRKQHNIVVDNEEKWRKTKTKMSQKNSERKQRPHQTIIDSK